MQFGAYFLTKFRENLFRSDGAHDAHYVCNPQVPYNITSLLPNMPNKMNGEEIDDIKLKWN